MLRKLKNGFIGFMCVLWVTAIWLIATMDYSDSGGAELNGFLAFILWIVSICLIVKVNALVSAVGSTVIVFIIRIARFGVDVGKLEAFEEAIGALVVCWVLVKLFFSFFDKAIEESEAKERRKKNAKDRGEACCPRCGSVSIQYYALGIPYDYDGLIRHKHDKYHCNSCGYEWW
jgi:hypothetical protein